MGQMRNIIYIINPISGTGSQRDLEKLIEQRSRLAGFDFEIFPSVASGDYSFILPVIREKKITDVVVAGGGKRRKLEAGCIEAIEVSFWYNYVACTDNMMLLARKIY